MKNKVKEIMDNYKKEVKKLDEKYEVNPAKKPNTKELENKIQYEKDFIAKLEFEGEETNAKLIENSKARLDKAMKEKDEIDEKYKEDLEKREEKLKSKEQLKNSTVVLESGREVKMSEKDKMDKADLKDRAIRDLTKESQEISKQLIEKDKELKAKKDEQYNFRPEYQRDNDGNVKQILNGDVIKKINEELNNITKEMSELNKMQKECDKYLEELKAPSKEDKNFVETWKEVDETEKGQNPKPEPTDKDIYSNSFIHINAAKGEAEVYLSSVDGKQVIGNIADIIENRKSKFERLGINEKLEELGVESRIKRFMVRRKINPVILEAIQEDEKLTDKYIEAVVNNEKFPFNYKLDLENSSLPSKESNFMNKLALKEDKIEGNEIIGAEKLHVIKNIFRSIKDKGQKKFKEKEEQNKLPAAKGKISQKNRLGEELKRQLEEQNKKYDEAYDKLSSEQKENLKEMNVSDLQRLGMDYTTACGVLDKYKTNEKEQKSNDDVQEKKEVTQEKQAEQKEGDEQTV